MSTFRGLLPPWPHLQMSTSYYQTTVLPICCCVLVQCIFGGFPVVVEVFGRDAIDPLGMPLGAGIGFTKPVHFVLLHYGSQAAGWTLGRGT